MQPATDQNQAFINDKGYIEVRLVGEQTDSGFRHLFDKVEPLVQKVKGENKPVIGIVDMTAELSYSLASNKAALELIESLSYDKLAMCNAPHATVVEGIIMATGRSDNTKLFKTRQDAEAWLAS